MEHFIGHVLSMCSDMGTERVLCLIDNSFRDATTSMPIWAKLFETFRDVCKFLPLRTNRQHMARRCGSNKQSRQLVLKHTRSIAKSRWGTIATNTRRLQVSLLVYDHCFKLDDFSDATENAKQMKLALADSKCRKTHRQMHIPSNMVETLRSWGISCLCSGVLHKGPCPNKAKSWVMHKVEAKTKIVRVGDE